MPDGFLPGRVPGRLQRWGSPLLPNVCILWGSFYSHSLRTPSRSRTSLISSNLALMFPFGNRICPSPVILLNFSQPSSKRIIAFLNPSLPWNRPTSCTTFSRALRFPSVCSSSPVITRKANPAFSSISSRRSVVGIPAADTLLNSSAARPSLFSMKSFSSRQSDECPWPMNVLFPTSWVRRQCPAPQGVRFNFSGDTRHHACRCCCALNGLYPRQE